MEQAILISDFRVINKTDISYILGKYNKLIVIIEISENNDPTSIARNLITYFKTEVDGGRLDILALHRSVGIPWCDFILGNMCNDINKIFIYAKDLPFFSGRSDVEILGV